jgi:hypothetical protein
MKNLKSIAFLLIFFNYLPAFSQSATQTVRGVITDKVSQSPIPGVIVKLVNSNPVMAVLTDAEGNFQLNNIPIGKQSLEISILGYKEVLLQNLTVNSGKELVLSIGLEEDIKDIKEIVIKAKIEKNKPLNEMSMVSTRTFSVEETQKFAAAVNDPGRMATSFAGVISAGDGSNLISIRGNSPNGLVWRMEGVEIPNPNHFSSVGTSGGGISILSAQVLSNSDFSTGAFASEYGNALSGVFDLKLRRGNNQKREYTAQIGLLGADISLEGPFKKGYRGSYLLNYRYSTLSILGKLGVPLGDAITNFQDISFNVYLPAKKFGDFSLFGFGGLSSQTLKASTDSLKWVEDDFNRYSSKFYSNTGAVGITNTKLFKNQSNLKTALVFSGTFNAEILDKIKNDSKSFKPINSEDYYQNKITLSTTFTKKLNPKSSIRTGLILNNLNYKLLEKNSADTNILITHINTAGNTQTAQAFFQWNYKLNSRFTTNLGAHYLQLFLNNTISIEPRASVKYSINSKNSFMLGYGLHSQVQPIGIYFTTAPDQYGNETAINRNLDLSRAHHFVLGHEWSINSFSRIKTEIYYQHLFNIPLSKDKSGTYSLINSLDGFYTKPLENEGLGKNYGLELTYERFTYKNLYYLISGSLYESKYKAPNNIWYNTQFNTNYSLVVTLGKEWITNSKRKNKTIGFNIKSVYVGGYRNTPIDVEASLAKGETVENQYKAFENKNPDYFRFDLRASVKRNYKKVTSTFALDIQNTTNRKNVGGQYYDINSQTVKYWYMAPLIPILSYKIEF